VQQGADDAAKAMLRPWRVVVAIIAANCVCLTCIVVGVWFVLRWSGAGETFTTIAAAGFAVEHGGRFVASDPWATMERLYLPLMAGVQGSAAIAGGLALGFVAGRRSAAAAVIGIVPLYVNTFASGLTAENTIWACAYVGAAVAAAYLIGREPQGFRA
jgi:hypothetical protein